ncbi:hypothetical protein M501DRAFT_1013454 [Patellaria atrata CBS 101060]|uniref:Mid2 domain-containing protein n=1 Tax=Patellaria atrata CBS 101060 TaxID=1346257 RepID=A0A9P4SHV8_9PEZI|nr:hypothetical protein M501DRAFT_1013454 [Patellaria atrata CBS 101060]
MQPNNYVPVLMVPALAVAMPWVGPSPTEAVQIDRSQGWSPAPTFGAERIEDGLFDLFKRQNNDDSLRTCGWIDADPASSLTCQSGRICATNSFYGVAGCCEPLGLDTCTLYTTCVPSSLMRSCTATNCLNNEQIVKCTQPGYPFCYNWLYDYITTTLTEFGCASAPWTFTVARTVTGGQNTIETSLAPPSVQTVTVTPSSDDSATSTDSTATSSSSAPVSATNERTNGDDDGGSNVGAIAGGVVGGVVGIAAIVGLVVFLLFRKKKNTNAGAVEPTSTTAPSSDPKPPIDPTYGQQSPPQQYNAPYGQQFQQNQYQQYPQQPATNTQSYYSPPVAAAQDTKVDYPSNVSEMPSTPALTAASPTSQDSKSNYPSNMSEMAGSPPASPAPQYSSVNPQPEIAQLDSTMVQPGQSPPQRNPEGNVVHEAP